MSTFMAKPAEIQRKWYIIDAADRPLGRTATKVADILRGKLKPEFTPHVDCGDHVVVINADKAVLTGKKLEKKFYRRHTGYIGGLKEVKYSSLMKTSLWSLPLRVWCRILQSAARLLPDFIFTAAPSTLRLPRSPKSLNFKKGDRNNV